VDACILHDDDARVSTDAQQCIPFRRSKQRNGTNTRKRWRCRSSCSIYDMKTVVKGMKQLQLRACIRRMYTVCMYIHPCRHETLDYIDLLGVSGSVSSSISMNRLETRLPCRLTHSLERNTLSEHSWTERMDVMYG
jgi:hypothetical protein